MRGRVAALENIV